MAKRNLLHFDVLVIGEHPSAFLAAAILQAKGTISVVHATPAASSAAPLAGDRLVLVNPNLFDLHPLLAPLKRKLDLSPTYGLRFFSDEPDVTAEYRARAAQCLVGSYRDIRLAMVKLAKDSGAKLVAPGEVTVVNLDESGVDAMLGKQPVRAKALVLSDRVDAAQARLLGLPESWDHDIPHRYTLMKVKTNAATEATSRPLLPISLNLGGSLCWGWLLRHKSTTQICVCQPRSGGKYSPQQLLQIWIATLRHAGALGGSDADWVSRTPSQLMLPLAGALAHEGVANRTLLIGPAGGFYSACAEDIYPNCWSAVFAADVIKKALREKHLQDALNSYRHKWRTTLGDYLRGPHQNLRYLLPLIYRNQVMADRMAESILHGKSMVRGE